MKQLTEIEKAYKLEKKSIFVARLKERMTDKKITQENLAKEMKNEYKKRIGGECEKDFLSSIQKWNTYTDGDTTTYNLPDSINLEILACALDCDTDYLLGIRKKPRADIEMFSERTKLSYDALTHLSFNSLLDYILTNESKNFYNYLKKLETAAKQEPQYIQEVAIPNHVTVKRELVKSTNDFTQQNYHRNLVKMKRWLEEWGDDEFLIIAAMEQRIQKLNNPEPAVDIYAQ